MKLLLLHDRIVLYIFENILWLKFCSGHLWSRYIHRVVHMAKDYQLLMSTAKRKVDFICSLNWLLILDLSFHLFVPANFEWGFEGKSFRLWIQWWRKQWERRRQQQQETCFWLDAWTESRHLLVDHQNFVSSNIRLWTKLFSVVKNLSLDREQAAH